MEVRQYWVAEREILSLYSPQHLQLIWSLTRERVAEIEISSFLINWSAQWTWTCITYHFWMTALCKVWDTFGKTIKPPNASQLKLKVFCQCVERPECRKLRTFAGDHCHIFSFIIKRHLKLQETASLHLSLQQSHFVRAQHASNDESLRWPAGWWCPDLVVTKQIESERSAKLDGGDLNDNDAKALEN